MARESPALGASTPPSSRYPRGMARRCGPLALLALSCLRPNPDFSASAGDDTSATAATATAATATATSSTSATSTAHTASGSTSSAWWDPAWKCRRELTIAGHEGEDLTDFPVMVRAEFPGVAPLADGADLRATSATGELPLEIERWEPTGATLWLGLAKLPSAGATVWLYWCGPASDSSAAAVWSSFEAVYHLADPLLDDVVADSTGVHPGSTRGLMGPDSRVPSPWGYALRFDGVGEGDFVVLDRGSPFDTDAWDALTVEAWARQTAPGEQRIFCKSPTPDPVDHVFAAGLHDSSPAPYFRVGVDAPAGYVDRESPNYKITLGEWFHYALTWSAQEGRATLFLDGAWNTDEPLPGVDLADDATIPAIGNINTLGVDSRHWIGEIDEVRIHRVRRSDAWIEHQVRAMRSPGIVTHGPDESL